MQQTARYILIATLLFFLPLSIPLFLIPIEKILPYPYIIEELVKFFLVLLILRISNKPFQIKLAIFTAFLFAFSENFFYLTNFISNENTLLFFWRFITTSLLHILTILIILVPSQKKYSLIFPALFLAIAIHYFYNRTASLFLP